MRGGATEAAPPLGWSQDRQVGVEHGWDLHREALAGQLPEAVGPEGFLEASEKGSGIQSSSP